MIACVSLLVFLFSAYMIARLYESGYMSALYGMWRGMSRCAKWASVVMVIFCTQFAGSKGITPAARMMRLLCFGYGAPWELETASEAVVAAETSASSATNSIAFAAQSTNSAVYTYSFDWHAPRRLPYHASQNVMACTPWVFPTNINGTLYEDHCVSFNATASTNPAVIYIEYARSRDDGSVERYTSGVVTSSYPNVRVVNLQSGSYTCYWFRCAVPGAFTNAVRDWSGEALFGAPYDIGKGFDMLGTLVVDDGNQVWIGATTNMVIGSITNVVRNGVITED